MKAVVEIIGYVKLSDMLGGGIYPFIYEDSGEFITLTNEGKIKFRDKSYVTEVFYS